jgi:hypothetical protein
VPFWWNLDAVNVAMAIHQVRPDIQLSVPVHETYSPIAQQDVFRQVNPTNKFNMRMSEGLEWNGEEDITGW